MKKMMTFAMAMLCTICMLLPGMPVYAIGYSGYMLVEEGTSEAEAYLGYDFPDIVFQEAKTLEEAERFALQSLQINARYADFSLEMANGFNRELTKAYNRYPDLVRELSYIGSNLNIFAYLENGKEHTARELYRMNDPLRSGYTMERAALDAENCFYNANAILSLCQNWDENRVIAYTSSGAKKPFEYANLIVFGGKFVSNPAGLTRLGGSEYSTDLPEHCIWHELGHLAASQTGLFTDAEELVRYLRGLSVRDAASGLSRYGTANRQELFAECWAEFELSENPRTIAAESGKLFRNFYQEWKTENRREQLRTGQVLMDGQGGFRLLEDVLSESNEGGSDNGIVF